jgi:putative phosphoesterase
MTDNKKILIISDSHGNAGKISAIIKSESPLDAVIHCGDGAGDLLHAAVPPGLITVKVAGNVDLHRTHGIERVECFELFGKKILITHGDLFSVQNGYKQLMDKAVEESAEVVFFGHTHVQYCYDKPPVLFNPGAANRGQYGIVTTGSTWSFKHRHL